MAISLRKIVRLFVHAIWVFACLFVLACAQSQASEIDFPTQAQQELLCETIKTGPLEKFKDLVSRFEADGIISSTNLVASYAKIRCGSDKNTLMMTATNLPDLYPSSLYRSNLIHYFRDLLERYPLPVNEKNNHGETEVDVSVARAKSDNYNTISLTLALEIAGAKTAAELRELGPTYVNTYGQVNHPVYLYQSTLCTGVGFGPDNFKVWINRFYEEGILSEPHFLQAYKNIRCGEARLTLLMAAIVYNTSARRETQKYFFRQLVYENDGPLNEMNRAGETEMDIINLLREVIPPLSVKMMRKKEAKTACELSGECEYLGPDHWSD